ncbi:MAG TPA: SAM-dependent methyltransferase [Methanocorpusculum sp.]|nr:SAM-dependent methyltransferase [Methanocorpusculum sp.]
MKTRITQKSNLSSILNEPWVDTTRRVYCDGETAYVPVRAGEPFDTEIADRHPGPGLSYQKMGDTIVLHGIRPNEAEFSALLAWEHPACVLVQNACNGVMRIPETEVLYGTPHDVNFTEAGISYTLNPVKVMFSQGNRNEKARLCGLVRAGERVADMFAGIGYFTLSAAKAGADVHAMEINPESYQYLLQNARANNLTIRAECGDSRNLLDGIYERILMGHFDAPDFLPHALAHSAPGTMLHVHGLGDRKNEILAAVDNAGFKCTVSEHKVKKYTARVNHNVWDVKLL